MTTPEKKQDREILMGAIANSQAIVHTFRVGLTAVLEGFEDAGNVLAASDAEERRTVALKTKNDEQGAAIAARQVQADTDFATAEATRLSTVNDLNRQIETQRVTLADLAGQLAEARATITKADELRADVKQKAGAL